VREENLSPLIEKYEKTLRENPESLVFAPLADCYRRLGSLDQALQILKEGLRKHPNYLLGHIGYAQVASDQNRYDLAYSTLRPFVESHRDNLKLMSLFANSCFQLEYHDEALQAFKYILFLNPRDINAANYVNQLENSTYQAPLRRPIKSNEQFDLTGLATIPESEVDLDEWVQKDLATTGSKQNSDEVLDQWKMEQLEVDDLSAAEDVTFVQATEPANDNEDRVFVVHEAEVSHQENEQPIITHTLVDLYLSQGYLDRAEDLLQKILELNPKDQKTKDKLSEVKSLMVDSLPEEKAEAVEDEESQHQKLMTLIDEKLTNTRLIDIETALWGFHQKLVDRSEKSSARR
jgi:tetratricopeptide (TPR) repeat protein